MIFLENVLGKTNSFWRYVVTFFGTLMEFCCDQQKNSFIIVCLFVFCRLSFAQQPLNMDEAVAIALANHPVVRQAALAEQRDVLTQRRFVELSPIQVKYWHLNTNSGNDRLWAVIQDFGSIPEHFRQAQLSRTMINTRQAERALTLDELAWQVKSAYMNAAYYRQRLQTMQEHEPYFEALIHVAEIQLTCDSISELTRVSAGSRYAAYQSRMYIAEEELKRAEIRLCHLLYLPDANIEITETELELYQIHSEKPVNERFDPVKHKALDEAYIKEAESVVKLERSKLFPAVHAGYIHQHIEGLSGYQGWMAGLSVPLWAMPQRTRIKQAEIDVLQKINETQYRQTEVMQRVETLKSLLNGYFVQISFSRENLLYEAKLMLEEVKKDFSAGRIVNFADTFTKMNNAVSAQLDVLEYLNLYNQTALELEFFTQ